MKFHRGQIVYRACLADFAGGRHAVVLLARIAVVCPQREGPPKYHLSNFNGAANGREWTTYSAAEDSLHLDPTEAMAKAVAGTRPGAKVVQDECAEGVAGG